MENWQVAVLVLASVLVGAALPALFELRATLKATRLFLVTRGERIERGLAELNEGIRRVEAFFGSASDLAASLQALADKVRVASAVGAAVGPAVAAAVRVLRAPEGPDGRQQSQAVREQ